MPIENDLHLYRTSFQSLSYCNSDNEKLSNDNIKIKEALYVYKFVNRRQLDYYALYVYVLVLLALMYNIYSSIKCQNLVLLPPLLNLSN